MASSQCVWTSREEEGGGVDETHDPFLGDDKLFAKRDAEMQQKLKRRDGSTMTLAQSKRANEMNKDLNAWEENRMFTSGVARARQVRGAALVCACLWHVPHRPAS